MEEHEHEEEEEDHLNQRMSETEYWHHLLEPLPDEERAVWGRKLSEAGPEGKQHIAQYLQTRHHIVFSEPAEDEDVEPEGFVSAEEQEAWIEALGTLPEQEQALWEAKGRSPEARHQIIEYLHMRHQVLLFEEDG